MESKSSIEIETFLNWWLSSAHGFASAISESFGALPASDPSPGLAMVVPVGLLIGLLIEVVQQKNRAGHRRLLASYRTNLTIFLCNNLILSSLSVTVLYAIAGSYADFNSFQGLMMSSAGWLITLIIVDFLLYVWHFANHFVPALWMFHKVHHSDASMNITTALRFHAGELVLTTAFKALLIALLSIPVEVILATEATIACFTLFHHMDIRFKGEQLLKWIFIVPCLHRVHHSAQRAEHDNNFGSVFSIWDRAFGTLRETVPGSIGLRGVPEQNAWQTFRYGLSRDLPAQPGPERVYGGKPVLNRKPYTARKREEGAVGPRPPGDRCSDHIGDLSRVFESNLMLMREVTECAWRFNFACLMAYAKATTFESAGLRKKPIA